MEDININSIISESYQAKGIQKPLPSLNKVDAQARVAVSKHCSSIEDPLFDLNDKIDDFVNPISNAPSSHIRFEDSTYTLLKKKSPDDNFTSQGKYRQKTQKNTTNTSNLSSTNHTSRDNDQKDLFSLLGFKCVNDDEVKTDTNDSIPLECKSPIKEILVKPKEEQEKTMKKIADDYYNQTDPQVSKKTHLELGRQMQEIRYWQAKKKQI